MDASSLWASAFDHTNAIDREYPEGQDLTLDQRLKLAEIMALLAIGQELSAFNPANVTYHSKDGSQRNGWGLPIPE